MNIIINKHDLLGALQIVNGVVEKRHTLPILTNILLAVDNGNMTITGTDMEIEILSGIKVNADSDGLFTLPARKLLDITRLIEDGSQISLQVETNNAYIKSGRSRFCLGSLPASEFPVINPIASTLSLKVEEGIFKGLLDKTLFAMALQDVRYYLNGMLLEIRPNLLRTVATDGHRLALSDYTSFSIEHDAIHQVILPRKTIIELNRLLSYKTESVGIEITSSYIRFYHSDFTLSSKIIDGRFPDYDRVIPKNSTKQVKVNRIIFKQGLQRASILSNEKFRGIRLLFSHNQLQLQAHNPEQEVAEEDLDIEYPFDPISIGFNVSYMIDVLNILDSEFVILNLSDENSSALIHSLDEESSRYVVMPMRL